ncbi:MAG: cache domain-containing protein [Desulfamplus sp.]|nr:cache domain-containing protein [Desulfamplus sp.]
MNKVVVKRLVSVTVKALWITIICLSFTVTSFAEEKATKDECIAKVKEAVEMAKALGAEATFAKLNDPKGQFVWKDSYVFCIDIESGKTLAHPIKPKLVGQMMKGLKDVKGKLFFVEFINVSKEKGEGWVDYMWPKPGEKEPTPKSTYVMKVEGTTLMMAAGVNE